jgi:sulfur carrier protein ThiS
MAITVKVVGVGINTEVTVDENATASDVLEAAGADSEALQVRQNGEALAADAPVQEGTVTATPSDVKLG